MIDTVILIVPDYKYHITKPSLFSPNANKLKEFGFIAVTFKNNYKTDEKYFPRLSITPRSRGAGLGVIHDLKIEFSVTKLIYGNNLQELTIFDETFVYPALKERLNEMGIDLFCEPSDLEVSGFDVSKNITLKKGYFSYQIIKEFSKCDIDKRLDLDDKDYKEGGSTLQFYTKNYAFVIYDKLADLTKSKNRSIDKDRNDLQKDLFYNYDKQEIIRFEARIRNKTKLKQVLKALDMKYEVKYFKDLFNEQLWKQILNFFWKGLIYNKNRFIFNMVTDDSYILDRILKAYPEIGYFKAIRLVGAYHTAKQKGLPLLRQYYEKDMKGKQWSKVRAELECLNEITQKVDCFGWFQDIDKVLSFDKCN